MEISNFNGRKSRTKLPRSRGGAKEEEMMNRWPGAFEAVGSRCAGGGGLDEAQAEWGGQIKVRRGG